MFDPSPHADNSPLPGEGKCLTFEPSGIALGISLVRGLRIPEMPRREDHEPARVVVVDTEGADTGAVGDDVQAAPYLGEESDEEVA